MSLRQLQIFEAQAVNSYAFRTIDLAVFRVLYATFVLFTVIPVAAWLPLAPRAFFYPPIGLAALFTAQPPASVLLGLNVLLALFAAMLLMGWKTGLASAGTGLTLLVLDSWAYSLGKINHDILMVVTPLVLGFSGWGRALSIDATRHPRVVGETTKAWPLALLALLVGFAMFTAGWAKVTTGWLDPQLRCTFGYLVNNYLFTERETWAARMAMQVDSVWFWKVADCATVALELAFLPAAFHCRSFRLILAVATLFHLGVLLLFDIRFGVNVLVYSAFIRYTELPFPRAIGTAAPLSRSKIGVAFVAAIAVGVAATLRGRAVAAVLPSIIVWMGAAVGTGYILRALFRRGQSVPPTIRVG